MIGLTVPIPVPMAWYSSGGWKDSLFGQNRINGPDGVDSYPRSKVVTQRWPEASTSAISGLSFPTST